jgi:hypothetical protein
MVCRELILVSRALGETARPDYPIFAKG